MTKKKDEALETVVISKLGIRKIHTIGLDGLRDHGFSKEEILSLRKIISREVKKPKKDRSACKVIEDFKLEAKKQRKAQKLLRVSSQDSRDRRQKLQLGLPVEGIHWSRINVEKKTYSVICSVSEKDVPDPQNAYSLFRSRVGIKNNFTASIVLAAKINNEGKINSAIITVKGIPKENPALIIRLIYELLTSEEKERGRWIKDEHKMSLICMACMTGSGKKYPEILDIIESCVKQHARTN